MAGEDLESRGEKSRGSYSNSSFAIEERETHWTSWLIPMFVVANVAVFVVAMYVNNCPKNNSGSKGKCVARLKKLGALERTKMVHEHQEWRLITCMWLHAGLIHLLVNMLGLIFIGIRLEQQFGFIRIGIIYLLSGFGGSILSSLFIKNSVSVGASGALFGLLGAMLSELITNWTIYSNKAAALLTLVVVLVINLGIGILPRVDNFAHIGGFLTGFLLGFVLLPRPRFGWMEHRNLPADVRVRSKYKAYQYVLWVVSLVLLVAGFTVGLVMLFRGANANDHCHWCHYLSCVPTDKWKCDET
ncbi:RHOMBOID-like protein [Actinidia chinensis var. chinensis]|uniref:RHOMBOID-like protein n=1 Tax=Actinidia chinensis var. chinensis TaxID=1590841 RepID=A0A2R6RWD7_ACTCC|nr:RHOMBOID-like protein [Actinidia chinensis var. chinensis]